ncbi:hypothetical protein F4774DRAFT_418588 [Daldinia eschscholtzii]|nr:hypothetical protein F4774DRAFT_418588 [Daldinia eschscholtzii]
MPTVLELLTRRNIPIRRDSLRGGFNSISQSFICPEQFEPWPDFDYETLTQIFADDLRQRCRDVLDPRHPEKDLGPCDELAVDGEIRRLIIPSVSHVLDLALGQPHLGLGSRVQDVDCKPDWSTISNDYTDMRGHINRLPEDTKVSSKWLPDMENYMEWVKPVSQVEPHEARCNSRYGFMIADECLVVMRFARMKINESWGRSMRAVHTRQASDATMLSASLDLSSEFSSMAIDSSGLYSENNPEEWSYGNTQAVIIPWDAGVDAKKKELAIREDLYFKVRLCMAENTIEYRYPGLDTWRTVYGGYRHNSSGVFKKKLNRHDVLEEPGSSGDVTGGEYCAEEEPGVGRQQQVDDEEVTVRPLHRSKKDEDDGKYHKIRVKKDSHGLYFKNVHNQKIHNQEQRKERRRRMGTGARLWERIFHDGNSWLITFDPLSLYRFPHLF